MSFFGGEGDPTAAPRRRPDWLRPPENVVPVVVPLGLVVGRAEGAVVAVPAVQAYPSGLGLVVAVRVRRRPGDGGLNLSQFGLASGGPELLRLGVRFADGRTATNLRGPRPPDSEETPPGPRLTLYGGSGSEGAWDACFWLWPLPPPGPLQIAAEWPAHHIPETVAEVDTAPLLAAAAGGVAFWPEEAGRVADGA